MKLWFARVNIIANRYNGALLTTERMIDEADRPNLKGPLQ